MNQGQYEGIMGVLLQIRDRMPQPEKTGDPEPASMIVLTTHHLDGSKTVAERVPVASHSLAKPRTLSVQEGAYQALHALLGVLDGWIQGARENHEGMGHRGEPVGSECWTQFHPSDIRWMVNDAAREMGLDEFPLPDNAKEDQVR